MNLTQTWLPEHPLDRRLLAIAWIIFPAGVLWEYLDWFETLRLYSAAPLMMGLTLWGMLALCRNQETKHKINLFMICSCIFILGMGAEIAGVKTGLVFGEYLYGEKLGPTIGTVPLAIGSAWVMMTLFSLSTFHFLRPAIKIPLSGLLATLFDALMEPAAVRLGYWDWMHDSVPVQNYLAWFILTSLFAWMLHQNPLSRINPGKLLTHLLLLQAVYFILVLLFVER